MPLKVIAVRPTLQRPFWVICAAKGLERLPQGMWWLLFLLLFKPPRARKRPSAVPALFGYVPTWDMRLKDQPFASALCPYRITSGITQKVVKVRYRTLEY